MEIIADTSEFYIERETAVAIGKFDGVHLGHRRLLDEVLQAKKRGLAACVFTFDPPPSVLFGGDAHVLTTNEEKHRIFERMGVDFLVEFPMTLETAATPPSTFIVDYLVGQLNTKFIVAGTDLSFGRRGEGNAALLKAMASEYDYDFKLIDKVKTPDGDEISSSLVRECIAAGNMEKAESLLGAPYSVTGTVVKGNHIGHTLGFPTINIYPDENKLLPPFGVYAGKTEVKEKVYRSISNVGCKPTVGGEVRPSVETYLYDFDGDLYGEEATVELSAFRRPETKFESLDALKAQLQRDIERY
ncbi:MAG: bifunctional riboflavin kinase/FAD synthetase [Lachnospiraceae bacterium]|nr:bifunctional riboflavin kinase/FAD synthetase [Lachnospiraceae bacterium]MBR1650063.1 bifunctional riboflavin kinase/FAD synthetase [Lachnospiraceae bacterium]